jgi:hypothetical protein
MWYLVCCVAVTEGEPVCMCVYMHVWYLVWLWPVPRASLYVCVYVCVVFGMVVAGTKASLYVCVYVCVVFGMVVAGAKGEPVCIYACMRVYMHIGGD